jgi:hypothetical protein
MLVVAVGQSQHRASYAGAVHSHTIFFSNRRTFTDVGAVVPSTAFSEKRGNDNM